MSKNVIVNGDDYTGVSEINLNTADGGTALFRDVDEITTPSGSKEITENGVHDVTNYASAVVNVAADSGEGAGFKTYTTTATGTANGLVIEGVDMVEAKMFIVEFKSQSQTSPVDTGYYTYGGLIVWIGGLAENMAIAESLKTAETTQNGETYTRSANDLHMYGLLNTCYFNTTNFSGNFTITALERTSTKTTISVSAPITAATVYDVVVHYL